MVEKMLPLLSDGLRKIVENIRDKHPNCDIANELLLADDLINDYNQIIDWRLLLGKETPIMVVARERIDQLINDEARMLSFRHNAFEISYLPKGKQAIYTDSHTWGRENRQTAKPARIIQKLLNREFKCKEFEDFSNWIKNEMIEAGEFVLVSGRDITKYYYEENYEKQSGTLGNSCMRHAECREYFKVYEDKAKLLICRKNDKILGRAIVWELPEGTFMDRIYTCYDYLENQFIDYAQGQKWHYRQDNSLLSDGEYQEWYGPEDNYTLARPHDLTIKLDRVYEYMPYIDSFRYYNSDNNSINTHPDKGNRCLSCTDGYYDEDNAGHVYICPICGHRDTGYGNEIPEDWVHSNWEDDYICDDCAVYCDGIDDYVGYTTQLSDAYNAHSQIFTYPTSYLENNDHFCCIDGTWYHKDCDLIEYNEETDSYTLVKQ